MLSPDQQTARAAFERGENVLITGPGGSGKTHLIRTLVEGARKKGKEVQVCALTGCASVLLECSARTVHSWAGIGLASGDSGAVVDRVCRNKYKAQPWRKADVLIIDEVSMMSKKLFDILDALGRRVRRQPFRPFGGIQLLFSGDFYQLPPVGSRDDAASGAFCFESEAWDAAFPCWVELRTMFRQRDPTFVKVLGQIRRGRISRKSCGILEERVLDPPADTLLQTTRLVPRRREADAINQEAMAQLEGESVMYTLTRAKDIPMSKGEKATLGKTSQGAQEAEIAYLRGNVMVPERLELKVGAQVMCVANIDMEGGSPIVNGSQGVVREFRNGLPLVEFKDGQVQVMERHVWPSETMPGVGVEQLPLIHAWAITIHKAQGVTLERAEIDAGSGVFECGQTYVALSRVKSLDGLYLSAFDPERIRVNRKVQDFYARERSAGPAPAEAGSVAVPVLAQTTGESTDGGAGAQRRPRAWTPEDDAYLWERARGGGVVDAEAVERLSRGEGAIATRIKHLRNPRHKAFVRLHGEEASCRARRASSSAAAAALAAARVACRVATDASGCSIGAWATQVLCEA